MRLPRISVGVMLFLGYFNYSTFFVKRKQELQFVEKYGILCQKEQEWDEIFRMSFIRSGRKSCNGANSQRDWCKYFAFFTRNPRGSKAKAEDAADAASAMDELNRLSFGKLVAHGAYTMNLCTADAQARVFAASVLEDDLRRMAALPGNYYNFHPGSHVGQGTETGICQIIDALKKALKPEYPVTVLLETMAGKGSEIGGRFEELREIIDGVGSEHVGVCLDTCHVWDGGYDIVNDLNGVLQEFDSVIGLDRLCALHLNDSKNGIASHKDRHECIGAGMLGSGTFEKIINHPILAKLPMILETPNELKGYQKEIAMLRSMEK